MVKVEVSEYLSAVNVVDGDTLKIIAPPTYRTVRRGDGEAHRLALPMQLRNGEMKEWLANNTTLRKLVAAWGDESDDWVGHEVKISKVKQQVRGELMDVLYGSPVSTPLPTNRY